jgi:hypothetical protein
MRSWWDFAILGALLCGFLIMPPRLAQDILDARIYFGTAPTFLFSIVIYSGQGLICLYLFGRSGLTSATGYSSVLLVAAYSTYELAFKLSFLLYGPSYMRYFTSYDVYPAFVLIVSILTLLAIRDNLNLNRAFLVVLSILILTWLLWLITGNFPVSIQAYEADPNYTTLLCNYATKLLASALFVFAAKGNGLGATSNQVISASIG